MQAGHLLNRKRLTKKPFSTQTNPKTFKYNNLIKGEKTKNTNQIIVGDVTAFDINVKDHYIALLIDLHNREIVGCSLSTKNNTNLVLSALEVAYIRRGNLSGCI